MKKLMIVMALAAGCTSVEVKNHGEEIVRDSDGKVLLAQDGTVQTVKKGWDVDYFQHWMITKTDSLTAKVAKEEIDFAMNGLNSQPDAQGLTNLVDTSFKGATELAARIGAAIATSGGSTAAEGLGGVVNKLLSDYIAGGGNVTNAVVSCTNGVCTVTSSDGTCSSCAKCGE